METYGRFLFEFLDQFFSGFKNVLVAIYEGLKNTFNIPKYYSLIKQYQNDFQISEWFLTGLAILSLAAIIGFAIAIIMLFLKKHMRLRKKIMNQEELLQEIDSLNKEVETLVDEKMRILSMQNPELGIDSKGFSDIGKPAGGTEEE